MALIKCKECGNEYSEYADVCPKCGRPRFIKRTVNPIIAATYPLYILLLSIITSTKGYSSEEFLFSSIFFGLLVIFNPFITFKMRRENSIVFKIILIVLYVPVTYFIGMTWYSELKHLFM